MKKKSLIVGLVGLPGAGKTTAAKYFERKGYYRITLSDFIKDEARKKGIDVFTREILQDSGNTMREVFGPQILAQLAHKKIREIEARKAVIDGIRNLYEVAYLSVENNFSLVGVVTSPRTRYERMKSRKERPLTVTYAQFLTQEHREESLGSKEVGLRVRECLRKAAYTIPNDKTEKEFLQSIETIIKTLTLH